jgi:hypothetical protein
LRQANPLSFRLSSMRFCAAASAYFPRCGLKRKSDLDNQNKLILDALKARSPKGAAGLRDVRVYNPAVPSVRTAQRT